MTLLALFILLAASAGVRRRQEGTAFSKFFFGGKSTPVPLFLSACAKAIIRG
jgi:hypothetical protein